MHNIIVADVMTRNPITISPHTNLFDCAKKMIQAKVGSLLITDGKNLLGFLSQRDILWAMTKTKSREDFSKIQAIEISPRKIATLKPNETLDQAIKKMKNFKFERFPVVQNGELVGMITIKDILNFNPEIYPEIEEFAQIREESEKLKRISEAKQKKEIREGVCEECGNRDFLYRFNGMLVCESCRDSA